MKKRPKNHDTTVGAFKQFIRNGRWGTCAGCPRDEDGNVYPEFCGYTERYDHQLNIDGLAHYYKAHTREEKND
jgi:hypothetical protein